MKWGMPCVFFCGARNMWNVDIMANISLYSHKFTQIHKNAIFGISLKFSGHFPENSPKKRRVLGKIRVFFGKSAKNLNDC